MDLISPKEITTYASLVQEATREQSDIVDSKKWELAIGKEKSQEQPLLPKVYNMAIDQLANKALNRFDLKSNCNGTCSRYG